MTIHALITEVSKTPTPVNQIVLRNELQQMDRSEILKESHVILIESTIGAPFMLEFLKENSLNDQELYAQIDKLTETRESFLGKRFGPLQAAYMDHITESLSILNAKTEFSTLDNSIVTETVSILRNEYEKSCEQSLYESTSSQQSTRDELEKLFALEACTMFMDNSYNVTANDVNHLVDIAYKYSRVMEVTTEAFQRAKTKGQTYASKTSDAVKKGSAKTKDATVKGAKAAGNGIKAIPKALQALIDNTVGRLKRMRNDQRRRAMLHGGMVSKLRRLVKQLIIGTAGFVIAGPLIGPITAAIAMLTSAAIDSHMDTKVRVDLLADMQQELKVVKEKIRDADAQGDKQAKYQLMRIEDALTRDIRRIQLRQEGETYRATDKEMIR